MAQLTPCALVIGTAEYPVFENCLQCM